MRKTTGACRVKRRSDAETKPDEVAVLPVESRRRKGRGAASNPAGRFEAERREAFDDGWTIEEDISPLKTSVQEEKARTIISRNDSPDIVFDRSINPYRGCEHGCTYCYARPTHSYMGLSPGLDFETRLFAKPNAAELLKRELSVPGYQVKPIGIGTNTDPYQPIEREHRITRSVLEVLAKADHPVLITTKSALIRRDIDLLAPMAAKGLVKVALSITTLDRRLSRAMEPRASTPERRLETVKALSEAGIPVAVLASPMIPALNDSELEAILAAAQQKGATEASYILLRLPLDVSELFRDFLLRNYPDRYRHVMGLIRSMRDGRDYDADFSRRMKGEGPYADLLMRRFEIAIRKLGLNKAKLKLNCDLFTPPYKTGTQLSLF